jgi:hypothetical protein
LAIGALTFAEAILGWVIATLTTDLADRSANSTLLRDHLCSRTLKQFQSRKTWLTECYTTGCHAPITKSNDDARLVLWLLLSLAWRDRCSKKKQKECDSDIDQSAHEHSYSPEDVR